ncbi:CG7304, partial [Drosophila busckii]
WQHTGYNAWKSLFTPVRRPLPDMRDDRCHKMTYQLMDPVSIIIVFRNEQLSMLLRLLHSLKERTDPELFGELILVNDHSQDAFWQEESSKEAFLQYVLFNISPYACIFHLQDQIGVVRARKFAMNEAKRDYLVFLDALMEVTDGWLEPLLGIICLNPTTVVTPQLDDLDDISLEYVRRVERRGLFDWTLRRREVPLMREQLLMLPQPYEMPVMRTAAFAVHANFYRHLMGIIDLELSAPQVVELELSLMVWRFDGKLLQVPCSHVGHLQPSDHRYLQRYGSVAQMGEQYFKSLRRLVDFWLDEPKYQELAYEYQPQLLDTSSYNVSDNNTLNRDLLFHNFSWYLQHIAPDLLLHFPLKPRADLATGLLRSNKLRDLCLTGDWEFGLVTLEPCGKGANDSQNWTLTSMNDLRLSVSYCAQVENNNSVVLQLCHAHSGNQHWELNLDYSYMSSNMLCLAFDTVDTRQVVEVDDCDPRVSSQRWLFDQVNVESFKS